MNANKFNRLLRHISDNERAFESIYVEYYPKIIMYLHRRFGTAVCAEDVAQTVFVSLIETKTFPEIKFPATWIYRQAEYKAVDILRKQQKEVPLPETYTAPLNFDDVVLKEDMRKIFERLDECTQKILYLHIWEGYSQKEIAEMMEMSCTNVRKKASRGYELIKKLL